MHLVFFTKPFASLAFSTAGEAHLEMSLLPSSIQIPALRWAIVEAHEDKQQELTFHVLRTTKSRLVVIKPWSV